VQECLRTTWPKVSHMPLHAIALIWFLLDTVAEIRDKLAPLRFSCASVVLGQVPCLAMAFTAPQPSRAGWGRISARCCSVFKEVSHE
jgi:hypothetical protein